MLQNRQLIPHQIIQNEKILRGIGTEDHNPKVDSMSLRLLSVL